MYIPHYINAALPKTMSRTQQVRHTVKSFRIFSLLTTIAAVMCDWTQLNYYTQLSLNDTFWGGVSVSIIVVLGLDVSMFFLGTVLNQYRKATGTTKGNFRFIGIGLLVTFLIAYVVYLLMAIPVLSQQASDGDVPFYGRLLIPIASSALAFFTSVGWDPKGEQIQRLLDGDAEQTTYEEQYDRIDRAYGNKLLSLDHNTSFKKGSNGWKEFLQWDKEIKDSMVAKFVALYPYEELAVIQNSKNDGISRRQQLNNRVKYAEACLQDSKWLLRDDFLRLAFLDYLVTEPPENSDKEKKDSMEIIRDFANREGPILERCRLKPYDPDKDALTQDFVRTLENK